MSSPITCLVTLHGIGFMQEPLPGVKNSGYADLLHEHLSKRLGALLSDDPRRTRARRGENGAIYVQSRWLSATQTISREDGLKRLGSWSKDLRQIETQDAPLVANDEPISHVALIYSHLEPQDAEVGAALLAAAMSLFSMPDYAHISGLFHMVLKDILAMVRNQPSAPAQQPASLRPRKDLASRQRGHAKANAQSAPAQSTLPNPSTPDILRNIEDDVACYVCHNKEREQVRAFVVEALLRLASRDDVEAIVFNTHSNGTVVGLDVIRELPPYAAAKIKTFITAGSPLRKYVDLFQWGQQIETPNPIQPWYNFWDECDPVADPLEPPISWHRGDQLASPYDPKLFSLIDPNSGSTSNIEVTDIPVDNVHKSGGGGLQAHNYWDNEEQFVSRLADAVRVLALTGKAAGEPVGRATR